MTREYKVAEGAAGERLDVFLAANVGGTRSHIQKLIKNNYVTVDGQPVRTSYSVQAGDTIVIDVPEVAPVRHTPRDIPIVYEDEDIMVVDKPAGMSAHAGNGPNEHPTVADFARSRTTDPDPERPGIVHRLDRDTSGLMIIAKTESARAAMQQQFRDHEVLKTYTLLAVGRVSPPAAVIRLALDRDPTHPLRRAVVVGGREAVTNYQTLGTYPGYTLIEAKPETGRTHQIRVHFAAVGHPVAGDTVYGAPKRTLGLKRHFLHASKLEFYAPSGAPLRLESSLPEDLTRVIDALEKRV